MARQYGEPLSFARDYHTIVARTKVEGFSFLTKTLPGLAKAIDKALVTGRLTPSHAFKRRKRHRYPVFLQVLMRRVFNEEGFVKTKPCIAAVRDLRQILYLCYKYEVTYANKVVKSFIDNFRRVDANLPNEDPEGLEVQTFWVLCVARTLLRDVVDSHGHIDLRPYIIPRHGPGAVATGEKSWEKMNFARKYSKIHQVFPYYEYFFANAADLRHNAKMYWRLNRDPEPLSKVQLVPKDSRGPRLICMEPLEFQYVQQGLANYLVPLIEAHPLTSGHVNFTDQEVNRKLALEGSIKRNCVTLDMKEASDRVSMWLVRELFSDTTILRYLEATRTEGTMLPDGDKLPFKKFAPMGSALCFPIEALVHWSIAVASLHVYNEITLKQATSAVYVFGDDIVIKGQDHSPLFDTFSQLGMLFNVDKCCTEGFFRESCGMDAFLGECVTPVKVKKPLPKSPKDANAYVSYLSYCNEMWERGNYHTSEYIRKRLENLYGRIPHVRPNSSVPGLTTTRGSFRIPYPQPFRSRYNADLQRTEYALLGVGPCKISRPNDRSQYNLSLIVPPKEPRPYTGDISGVKPQKAPWESIYPIPRRIKFKRRWTTCIA
jgi:hypothetical protein